MTETAPPAPMLSLPVGTLGALHHALAAGRSPTEAAEAARRLGYESGPAFYSAFQGWLAERGGPDPQGLDASGFWSRLSEFFERHGWGRLRFEQLHPGVAELSSDDWAEAETEGRATHPCCHITTGLLADLLGRLGGAELAVLEVECRGRGDERCSFLIGGRDALDRVYEELRVGASAGESVRRLG